MPVLGFQKPKILNQTIAFCYGFQKTDAKLRGAFVGSNRLGFFNTFLRKHEKCPPGFAISDLRFVIRKFRISGFGILARLQPHRDSDIEKK